MHRFKRFGRWLLIGLLVIGFVYWLDSASYGLPSRLPGEAYPPQFTVSKETTYFTGPLDKNGYLDYAKALNETLSAGIEPEKNVIVALLPAMGPKPLGKVLPPDFFTGLGAPAAEESDRVMISFGAFVEADPKLDSAKRLRLTRDDLFESLKKPWAAKNQPEISAWLEANEKALACAVAASHQTQFYYPLVFSAEVPAGNGVMERAFAVALVFRELGRGLLCRAQLKIGKGQFEEARGDLLCVHRLARLLVRGPMPIDFLVSRALELIAFEADEILLRLAEFPRKTLELWASDLEALPEKTGLKVSINRGERSLYLESAMLMNQIGPSEYYLHKFHQEELLVKSLYRISNISLDYDLVLKEINKNIDFLIDLLNGDNFPDTKSRLDNAYDAAKKKIETNKSNYIYDLLSLRSYKRKTLPVKHGENLLLLMLWSARGLAIADTRSLQQEDLFRLALALAIHRKSHGAYPEKLEQLDRAFLKEIPGDRFSHGSLIYSKGGDGYILYSVGLNGKDEEGRGPDSEPIGDDLILIMAPPVVDQAK